MCLCCIWCCVLCAVTVCCDCVLCPCWLVVDCNLVQSVVTPSGYARLQDHAAETGGALGTALALVHRCHGRRASHGAATSLLLLYRLILDLFDVILGNFSSHLLGSVPPRTADCLLLAIRCLQPIRVRGLTEPPPKNIPQKTKPKSPKKQNKTERRPF